MAAKKKPYIRPACSLSLMEPSGALWGPSRGLMGLRGLRAALWAVIH
jgi:hypothetical protein